MLIPRFSIRWVLLLTTFCAVLFIVMAQAVRGRTWAMAITGAVAFVGFTFILYAASFLSAYALAQGTRTLNPPEKSQNPFIREGAYPPQMVPKGPYGGSGSDET